MKTEIQQKECVGNCPKCGSTDLDYDCSDATDNIRVYPFTCCQCGCEGKEVWKEVYIETEYTDPIPDDIDPEYEAAKADLTP